ncbi:tetratricopeptide repeat protein [Ningiella sp. W23]|uniref:tetratricopeptide repeat protein n=1 Tax=Ningiella sp. W23 TaxID=3023715 RepID=UPI0037566F69
MNIKWFCIVVVLSLAFATGCSSIQFDERGDNALLRSQIKQNDLNFDDKPISIFSEHLHNAGSAILAGEQSFSDQSITKNLSPNSDIFALSRAQKAEFDAYFLDKKYAHISEHTRFAYFLESRLESFTYHGATYKAGEAFEKMSGNCLSLAILTTALANHAGLEIEYQRVNSAPVYSKHGNIMLLSTHVRTRVYGKRPPFKPNTIVSRPFVTIDYFPNRGDVRGDYVSAETFLGMYYRNVAAQALIDQDIQLAYQYIAQGLSLDIKDAESLNLLALLMKRSGLKQEAAAIYQDMLDYELYSLNAVENYANLLNEIGFDDQAHKIWKNLPKNINEDNPYQWLRIAQQHYKLGEMRLALRYAQKASEKAPYLHEPYHLIAKVHFDTHKLGASRKALEQAKTLSKTKEQEKRYLAKLHSLTTE